MKKFKVSSIIFVISLFVLVALISTFQAGKSSAEFNHNNLKRISVDNNGQQAFGHSEKPRLSADGRYITFSSYAGNLVEGDNNGQPDIFMYDRNTENIKLISKSTNGVISNGFSTNPSISDDGRFIAYQSAANNLVADDTNAKSDIFLFDNLTNTTTRESVANGGAQASNSSSPGDISADGRYVVFHSAATDLVPGDNNGIYGEDVFLRDRQLNTTTLISKSSEGVQGNQESRLPTITPNGRYVVFNSYSTNLVPNDTNDAQDIFRKDVQTGEIMRVSVSNDGAQAINASNADPAISVNDSGDRIVFSSNATNLINGTYTYVNSNVYIRDLSNNTTKLISRKLDGSPANNSEVAAISGDGRYITFLSLSNQLVVSDNTAGANSNIFRYDAMEDNIVRISKTLTGSFSTGASVSSAINRDCSFIAFDSHSSNFVENDTNSKYDIFLYAIPDSIAPIVTGIPNKLPNSFGWYNSDVSIDWLSSDPAPSSGVPTDPADTLASIEGAGINYTSEQSCDPVGNCATGSLQLSIDKTPPLMNSIRLSRSIMLFFRPINISADVSDGLSGISGQYSGEFFIDNDPGVGNATPMGYANGALTATITQNPGRGLHLVQVRTQDKAGNWSQVRTAYIFVLFF